MVNQHSNKHHHPGCQHPAPLITVLCTCLCTTLPNALQRTPSTTADQHPLSMVVDAHHPLPPGISAAIVASLQRMSSNNVWLDVVRPLVHHTRHRQDYAAFNAALEDMVARVACNMPALQQPCLVLLSTASLDTRITHTLECMTDIAAAGGEPVQEFALDLVQRMLTTAALLHRPRALAPLLACHARLRPGATTPAVHVAAAALVLDAGEHAASLTLGTLAADHGALVCS